ASLMNLVSVEKLDKPIRSKVFSPILALTVSTMFIYEIYLKYFHEPDESYFDVLDKFAKGEIRRTLDRYADECAEVNSVIEKRVELYKGKVDGSIDDDIYN